MIVNVDQPAPKRSISPERAARASAPWTIIAAVLAAILSAAVSTYVTDRVTHHTHTAPEHP